MKRRKSTYDRNYLHFDRRKKYVKWKDYVSDAKWVKSHGFYPFIHFELKSKRMDLNSPNGKKAFETKSRPIMYAAHIDRFIYKYYGSILNNDYNEYMKKLEINEVATAYRSNMNGKNNAHFAKDVFEFIASQDNAFVYLGDFKGFFDNLDHKYLKDKIRKVQNVKGLGDAEYAIYKNLTRYSFIKLADILTAKGVTGREINSLDLESIFDTSELREFKTNYLHVHRKQKGIPQGSSISAVYANVYLVDFDLTIEEYVKESGGLYRRYSDDFVIILPFEEQSMLNHYEDFISKAVNNVPELELSEGKTEEFIWDKSREHKLTDLAGEKKVMNYLGFAFDGEKVRIRDRSLFKYYTRAYRKAQNVARYKGTKLGKKLKKELLNHYTYLGDHPKKKGNFLTYARRSDALFKESKILSSEIANQVKRHWKNINKKTTLKAMPVHHTIQTLVRQLEK
ncbi:reverse transcriptase domain-containing protein [Sporosarcina sp. FSL K6-5500]|uniref:reverse transcriptase domain-containing protein n=1 Tax=Sporosarcina sp. FSL K6-5500 TaxID=2921558 RepID=UPI0030F85677